MSINNTWKNIKSSSSSIGHMACFATYTIFGFNIIVCKDLMGSNVISPLAIFTMRSLGAGVLFWIVSALICPNERIEKKDFYKIFAASVLGFFLTQLTFLMAIPMITPMDCSIISSLSPIYTMIIAAIVLKEPITTKKVGGVILSLCGVIFLILNSSGMGNNNVTTDVRGILLMIANSLCFSLYLGIFKPVIQKYSVITFMKWIFFFSTCMSLPFSAKELVTLDYSAIPAIQYYELTFLIICSTFITYFLIPVGQKRIRPTLVSMYAYVQPIIAITISICIGMDVLTWQKIVAAIAVFTGVVIVSFSKSAKTE